jgi:translation initiation factor 3 subunit A
LQLAAPEFQNLYKWLEIDFDPLNLCKHVGSVTDGITNDENNPYVQYVQALQDVTLFRLVRQICQVKKDTC